MAHIVILGSAYPLRAGGLSTFNERLSRALQAQGHHVTIFTFSLQYPGLLFPGKTQYADGPGPDDLHIKIRLNSVNPLSWLSVGKEIKKLRPDYLIIRYWIPFMAPSLGTVASLVKRNRHTRVVALADNIVPHEKRPGDAILTRYFIRHIHRFVAMSQQVRDDLTKFGISPSRISLCPHPLYDNFGEMVPKSAARKMLNLPEDKSLILFFGFIRDYKGLDLLIKAMARHKLEKQEVILLVAGEFYTSGRPYHELAREAGVEGQIIWNTQFIPSEMVRYYFCASDLVVQPYKSATQSGVTQIAYHFEKPMVVTDVGGLPEMVPHGRVGYVVKPEAEAIAEAITDFFENKRASYFIEQIKTEKTRFSWSRLVESLLYEDNS